MIPDIARMQMFVRQARSILFLILVAISFLYFTGRNLARKIFEGKI